MLDATLQPEGVDEVSVEIDNVDDDMEAVAGATAALESYADLLRANDSNITCKQTNVILSIGLKNCYKVLGHDTSEISLEDSGTLTVISVESLLAKAKTGIVKLWKFILEKLVQFKKWLTETDITFIKVKRKAKEVLEKTSKVETPSGGAKFILPVNISAKFQKIIHNGIIESEGKTPTSTFIKKLDIFLSEVEVGMLTLPVKRSTGNGLQSELPPDLYKEVIEFKSNPNNLEEVRDALNRLLNRYYTGSEAEFLKVISVTEREVSGLFEEYNTTPEQYSLLTVEDLTINPDKRFWNKDYFGKQRRNLLNNFSKNRLLHLIKVKLTLLSNSENRRMEAKSADLINFENPELIKEIFDLRVKFDKYAKDLEFTFENNFELKSGGDEVFTFTKLPAKELKEGIECKVRSKSERKSDIESCIFALDEYETCSAILNDIVDRYIKVIEDRVKSGNMEATETVTALKDLLSSYIYSTALKSVREEFLMHIDRKVNFIAAETKVI